MSSPLVDRRRALLLSWLFAGVAAGVALLVVVEGCLAVSHRPFVVSFIESKVGGICHHSPTRSLGSPSGIQQPVCARCTGMYLGWVCGTVLGFLIGSRRVAGSVWFKRWLFLLAAVCFIGVTEPLAERIGLLQTTNGARVVCGVPLGLFPAFLLTAASLLVASTVRSSEKSAANKGAGANSRPASPLDAGRQFGCTSCAPPSLSAAVGQF
jgi:uncharacterized membrane protein